MERAAVSPPRRGVWRRRLLASGAALLCACGVLEVLARVRFGAPLAERLPIVLIEANEHSGWRMVPRQEHYTYLHPVHVNAFGLRGPELSSKARDERRVLALGDSLIYGQGVPDADTVPVQLAELLNADAAPGTRWTVVNGGHRAYDTHQELRLLEELGAGLVPDVVIIFWYWNDFWERDIPTTCEHLRASGPVTFDTGEAMEGWPRTEWKLKQLLRRSALLMTVYDLWKVRDTEPVQAGDVEDALRRLDGYLERFQELAARDGFQLVFAALPDANELQGDHPSAEFRVRAEALAAARGIVPCLVKPDLEALARSQGALPVLPYDGHYTGPANRAIAAAVARCLNAK
jgi:hypothetical protein